MLFSIHFMFRNRMVFVLHKFHSCRGFREVVLDGHLFLTQLLPAIAHVYLSCMMIEFSGVLLADTRNAVLNRTKSKGTNGMMRWVVIAIRQLVTLGFQSPCWHGV